MFKMCPIQTHFSQATYRLNPTYVLPSARIVSQIPLSLKFLSHHRCLWRNIREGIYARASALAQKDANMRKPSPHAPSVLHALHGKLPAATWPQWWHIISSEKIISFAVTQKLKTAARRRRTMRKTRRLPAQ